MKILGINFSNDSAASMLVDDRITMAVQEERFRREKHFSGFPEQAISACLASGKTKLADVDSVAFFWNPAIHAQTPNWRMSSTPRHHMEFLYDVPNFLLPKVGRVPDVMEQVFHLDTGKKFKVYYVTHHLAHAAGALFTSPHLEAAILTVDGYGERDATTIWTGRKVGGTTEIKRVWSREFPHSLGAMYAAVTQFLGFKANSGEGKVMGLASYGTPRYLDEFRKICRLTDDGYELDLTWFSFFAERPTRYSEKFVTLFGEPRKAESAITTRDEDIAASLQAMLEEAIIHLARLAKAKTGMKVLCMSGGVTLNCSANGRLLREDIFEDYFFQPASGDAGTSLGAALYVNHCIEGRPRDRAEMLLEYLGPQSNMDEVLDTLEKGSIEYLTPADAWETAGQLLAKGYIGSVFQGRAEFGPRALGNRSTLSDPRPAAMKDRLNATVKFREGFRPFAPSIHAHRANEYFEGCTFSPFMLRVYPTRPEKLDEARAVTHVDGGARVQTVTQEQNPNYFRLISSFEKQTGTPMVLNTSFNIRGEPIVNSPSDAVKCFLTTGQDFLVLEDVLLVKNRSIL
jgi:carbamoyltransferase